MVEPWQNILQLSPPVHTVLNKNKIDVKGLNHACDSIIKVLSKQSPLHKESALLSRFLYKYDKKFRNDIGYRGIKKTNSTLRKYLEINLLRDVENFVGALPNDDDDDYLSTRQMLEYVVLRIITFAKLMVRIYVCSKQAAVFYLDRVKRGESHWMSLMPYALLSRIWSISAVLLQHSTSWYSCLHAYLNQLQYKGLPFLPVEYQLPKDLEEWLDLKNLDTFGKLEWTDRQTLNIRISLPDDEGDTFDNILEFASQINEESNEPEFDNTTVSLELRDHEQLQVSNTAKVDQGQAISRESFNILTNFKKKITNDKVTHYFGRVTNIKSLNEFIGREEAFRNDGDKQSLTNHLSFMQWHTLKISLLKVCNSLSNNRKVERKLQKVWKEKCLEYI